jgi:hypothetical protein
VTLTTTSIDYWKTGCAGKLTVTQHSAVKIIPTASENDVFNALRVSSKDYKALLVTTSRVTVQQQFEIIYLQFLLIHF